MKHLNSVLLGAVILIGCQSQTWAIKPTSEEMTASKEWMLANLSPQAVPLSFSFQYGGRTSSDLLKTWKREQSQKKLDENRTMHTLTFTDPDTGLEVRAEAIAFSDFPALEWVLYFKNTGSADTPILEKILPLDARNSVSEDDTPLLRYALGATSRLEDFAPRERTLEENAYIQLQPRGGRPSSEYLPFFNIDSGRQGIMLAIGWTGEWSATFSRGKDDQVRMQAGMATTHLKLHPGEEIRTPRILLLFWRQDRMRGHNLLRRFILAHHRPRVDGGPLVLPIFHSVWGNVAASQHLKIIDRIIQQDLPIEYYWIDAGWYGEGPWWLNPGNWNANKGFYPHGFKPISDRLHQSGRKLLLWFECQRVCRGTTWYELKERPNWLLEVGNGNPDYQQRNVGPTYLGWGIPHDDPRFYIYESRRTQFAEGDLLFNMAHPEARQFLTDFLSSRIEEWGIDCYREDVNIAPLEYWQNADAPDRQGIMEIRYVEGLYAFWDELLRRHPHLIIDNCSSGGRRLDLESISRSTVLWRSDSARDARHAQCQSYGLFSWVPLHMAARAAVPEKGNEYELRSFMGPGLITSLDVPFPAQTPQGLPAETMADLAEDAPQDVSVDTPQGEKGEGEGDRHARRLLEEYLSLRKFYYGDFYPLTEYNGNEDAWMVWQFDLPESGDGMVQAFRRGKSPHESGRFQLKGLQPDARYSVKDIDAEGSTEMTGGELMEKGLLIAIPERPSAVVITYETVR